MFGEQLFGTTHGITMGQECARAIVIFAYGLLLVRIAGRRIFGKWSALDIIVSIIVGSNLSRALTGSAPLVGTLVATTLLMALHWVLAQSAARWPRLSHLLEGRPILLAKDGRLDSKSLVTHAVTEADLREALRAHGLEEAGQVRQITLEPSGRLSVLRKA